MGENKDLTELQIKIEKIVELTRATRDEAVVALHDCDDQLDKAIDMILEGESLNVQWRSIGKKRKPKTAVPAQSGPVVQDNDDKFNVNDSSNAGERKSINNRGRGPRLQRGGVSGVGAGKHVNRKKDDKMINENASNENDENASPEEGTNAAIAKGNLSSRGRGVGNSRGRGRGGPTRGSFNSRGGGRGARLFQNKGYRNNVGTVSNPGNDAFPNSIDTWTNSTAEQANDSSTVARDGTTVNVGNWSDFVGAEDWSEEDWDSNVRLMETKVFTPSTKATAGKENASDMTSNTVGNASQGLNFSSLLAKQNSESTSQHSQQPISSILGSNVPRNTNTSSAGAALLQQLQQGVSSASQINKFSMSQYTKQATENIKSLVGIPTSSYSATNSSMINAHNLDNQVNELSSRQIENQSEVNQQSNLSSSKPPPPRLSKMRSSKIPESAVEMPSNDSISALNVQFGALPFDLGPESSNAFHDVVNHVKSSNIKKVGTGTALAAPGSSSLSSAALLNVGVSDNAFRNVTKSNNQPSGVKTSTGGVGNTDLVLQNSVLGHQGLPSDISALGSDRAKGPSSSNAYSKNVFDNSGGVSQNDNSLYQSSVYSSEKNASATSVQSSSGQQQQQGSDLSAYGKANQGVSYQQADSNNAYGSNVSYGTVTTATPIYSSNNATPGAGYPSAGFRTQTTSSHTVGAAVAAVNASQKSSVKDLDPSGTTQHKHPYDLQGVSNITPSGAAGSLGLVSNSTVTTNVLKNSLTATGKGIPNVPPGVPPLLGTQYIMSQAGLPGLSFYPFYDVQIPAAHGRDHNFAYSANTDLKYSRADNDGSNPVSTQSPVSQNHNQAIFGHIPQAYSFFYTPAPGVNMMPQSLYGPPAPFLPVPATNAHTGSTGSGFPKGTTGYGSHTYPTAPYDSLAAVPPPSDYVKPNAYAPSSGQQQVKGINTSNANDLSVSNAMYGKNHPQLSKTYEKSSFQTTGTPPPFNMAGAPQANTLGSTYAPTPSQYIQMLPQTQPSMLHHTLQGDASQSVTSGVGAQRSLSQGQKGPASNTKQYYWN